MLSKLKKYGHLKVLNFNSIYFPKINCVKYVIKNCNNRIKYFSTKNKDQNNNFSSDEPFPKYDKKDFYDENDLIINIGEKEKYKGLLVICPTPIGNLNDISIRQYEAMKNADILACEDTRKTGKLLELIQLKKMKERFYSEFGIGFDEFVNKGGLDMEDEQIKNEFLNRKTENDKDANDINNNIKENYHHFYEMKEDREGMEDFDKFQEKIEKREKDLKASSNSAANLNLTQNKFKSNDEKKSIDEVSKILNSTKIKKFDKINDIVKEINLNYGELDEKEIIKELKKDMREPVTSEYYSQVIDENDFFTRKTIIENSEDDLKTIIEPLAEEYDKNFRLSYKLRNKAKFIMGMNKKYHKKTENEDEPEEKTENEIEEDLEAEVNLNSGLEDNYFGIFKKKIKEEKLKKGRGLLVPFNQQNEEKKIPKLIRAMKLGLRVVVVSDAGTPTISDPGYRLVREATKNGIIVEPIPGPSAVLTALSASALPTDKFLFYGYLPKNSNDKIEKFEEIKKIGVTTVLFESPHRISRTLETMIQIFGRDHEIYIGLELTKKFETHMYGSIQTIFENLDKKQEIKGEITLIISPVEKKQEEIDDQKNLNDEVKIEALEFARKINSLAKLSEKEFKNIMMEVCNISNFKANKIINSVKNRQGSVKDFINKTSIKVENLDNQRIDENLIFDKKDGDAIKNYKRVIKKTNIEPLEMK
jgi:16S rRNA (cytidine1402-2'-O)-methyltransferase